MPQPCMGSRAMVLRMRTSKVPCTRSVGLLMELLSVIDNRLHTLLSIVKGSGGKTVVLAGGRAPGNQGEAPSAQRFSKQRHSEEAGWGFGRRGEGLLDAANFYLRADVVIHQR